MILPLTLSHSVLKDKPVFVFNFEHAFAWYNNPVKHSKVSVLLLTKNQDVLKQLHYYNES